MADFGTGDPLNGDPQQFSELGLCEVVLASIIIRYSGHPSVVMMEPVQYRKCDDLSSTVGGRDVSS